jgi:uncharacterized protein YegJ (DUF2314 family)
MKLSTALLFLPFFLSCSNNHSDKNLNSDKLGLDTAANIYSVTSEDSSMNSAIDKAKKTIGEFDKGLESNNSLYTDFAIKKRYKTPDDGGEHMWITVIGFEDGKYKGIVNNDAEKTTEVKYGDTVIVRKDEITDWMFLANNVLKGGYTIRVIRDQMSKNDRMKMDKELGYKIED